MDILEKVAEIRAKKSREEGIVEGRHAVVKKLVTETNLSEEKIASLADVSVDAAKKIKKSMHK
jgi:hypothetical protein